MQISIGVDNNLSAYSYISGKIRRQRPGKGKSLIDFPDNYIVIDIETTGLDSRYCEIIEISAIRYIGFERQKVFSSLVKPTDPIDDFISNLTGITDEMVADAPGINAVMVDFLDFVGSDILVGYSVNFDINFIYDVLQEHGMPVFRNDFVDALRLSRKLNPGLRNHKLSTVAEHYGITISGSHRALADCETCNACFLKLREDAFSQYGSIDAFRRSFGYSSSHTHIKAKDITAKVSSFDPDHPLYGRLCVFTGSLEKMHRKDAMQLVADHGGMCGDNVTRKTNYLILGNNDFCKTIKDGKSNKQKKAEELMLAGYDIEILSENVFYDMVFDDKASLDMDYKNIPLAAASVYTKIQEILDDVIRDQELPADAIHLYPKIPANGKAIMKSIRIFEPLFPSTAYSETAAGHNTVILSFKRIDEVSIEFAVKSAQFQNIPLPSTATARTMKSSPGVHYITFSSGDDALCSYIRENILYCLSNYKASSSFGCCGQFVQCSDAKKCIHKSRIYSMGCQYRANLEAGRIFYGKNKNI